MVTIGITGSKGFIGHHLYNALSLQPDKYRLVEINRNEWEPDSLLFEKVNACDVIFHLAGINRHSDNDYIFQENIRLTQVLVDILNRVAHPIKVVFSSSSQEATESIYGKAKKVCREVLENWANQSGNLFFGLLIPNVFGSFGKPFYNSFIATFCYQLNKGEAPTILTDSEVPLIYVADLVKQMEELISLDESQASFTIQPTTQVSVSSVLAQLNEFKSQYLEKGIIPELPNPFSIQLFNTFRSYLNYGASFPKPYTCHTDNRGSFVELVRLGMGGQVSFSTTLPGITRGNHFHTRKIERFSVIQGKAKMELRRYGTSDVDTFYLDGDQPSYVDIPVWYYHNITNIGNDVLYTIFWISEQFNPDDADTYFE
jgi:UDP-2-acetamido-2,6-beta-L-arabino-hexul-4-ose reductase